MLNVEWKSRPAFNIQDSTFNILVSPSRSIPSRRNPLRLADGQLRHHLDELASRLVRVLEGVTEHLDVLDVLFRGNGEARCRQVLTRRCAAPPRAVDVPVSLALSSLTGPPH